MYERESKRKQVDEGERGRGVLGGGRSEREAEGEGALHVYPVLRTKSKMRQTKKISIRKPLDAHRGNQKFN